MFQTVRTVALYPLRLPRALWRGAGVVVRSFRFWVFLLLVVIATLIAYYATADRHTPFTTEAYVQAFVVQVAPQVAGQVVKVHVHEGQHVTAGDLLFELDPRPFEHKVRLLNAKLVEAGQQVKRLYAERAAAEAEHERLKAELDYAAAVYKQEEAIFRKESTTERKYLDALLKHKASEALVQKSARVIQQTTDSIEATIGDEHALVAQVKAQLAEAELNLSYCRVTAPCTGVITNLQLRDGAFAHTGQAVLACIDTSQWVVVANFRENSLAYLRAGQPVLVGLRADPGTLYPGHVEAVGGGVGQGQGVPSGLLPQVPDATAWVPPSQRFQVRVRLDDPAAVPLRVGMTGSVSVYPQNGYWLNDITLGLHRAVTWLYYL